MKITKYGHACVRLEKAGRAIVIDAGELTPQSEAWDGVEAALVTHEHIDHFSADNLRDVPAIFTCEALARRIPGLRTHAVLAGTTFSVAGFDISVVGEKHHFHHPDVPPVDNVGFLVDGEVFHPGDALTIVDAPTLLVPGQAPWLTTPMMIEYLRASAPKRAYAIHEGLVNEWGLKVLDGVLEMEAERAVSDYRRLETGESVDI
ncbi:MBL fold metallo-hydrolase [Herbidospora cretacea]|uniref:MBL fold metallo-hydrolase n=1 Tax=Herbidospora cretacea TaxID=28444 RepID=UPI0004C37916|nr:MBL fold metallo-hydrolase [Herbidospora cretacea]